MSAVSVYTQYVLNPAFVSEHIGNLDKSTKLSRAYDGTTYLPGRSHVLCLHQELMQLLLSESPGRSHVLCLHQELMQLRLSESPGRSHVLCLHQELMQLLLSESPGRSHVLCFHQE